LSGQKYLKPDGTLYQSGTEYEFENATNAKVNPPHVLVYYRTSSPPPLTAKDPDLDEKHEQLKKLGEFLKRFDKVDGTYKFGYATYESPQQFRDRLTSDLRTYAREQLRGTTIAPRAASPLPPWSDIALRFATGQVVPFIGPGVLACGRGTNAAWDPSAPKFLPSGEELSRVLASEAHLPSEAAGEHLAEIASFYEAYASRGSLRERLRKIFGSHAITEAAIPPLYTLLAGTGPTLIVTTNYDTLLERAFHAIGRPYDLVVYPAELKEYANAVLWWPHDASAPKRSTSNDLRVALDRTTVIFKMHGTIQPENDRWDGTVITEADYVEFLSRLGDKSAIPAVLLERMRDRSLLFLGFTVRDWSSRMTLRNLKRRTTTNGEEIRSWAIASAFSELELLIWRMQSVYPFEMDLDEFARELRDKLPR
jgi:hypothetical protein